MNHTTYVYNPYNIPISFNMMKDQKSALLFKTIGARIKARRQELKLTQAAFAKLIGCDKRYFQKIEAGRASTTVMTLQRIAEALQLPLEALVRAEAPPPIETSNVSHLNPISANLNLDDGEKPPSDQ